MNHIMKKLAIGTMALAMAGLATVSNVYADEMVSPLANAVGTVLYRYDMNADDVHVRKHNGIDILYTDTTLILSPFSGKVVACDSDEFGAYVVITDTEKGDSILVSNMRDLYIEKGTKVQAGDVVGMAAGEYVHVSYYPKGFKHKKVTNDPTAFLTLHGTPLVFDKSAKE